MKASDIDARFDGGEDITVSILPGSVRWPLQIPRRINVDFPSWIVQALDREAKRLGLTRQAVLKFWIAERLERTPP